MTPQYPSLVFYDNGCMVGWMHECLKIGMYLIPSIRSASLEQIINGIFREIFAPVIPSQFHLFSTMSNMTRYEISLLLPTINSVSLLFFLLFVNVYHSEVNDLCMY